MDGVEVAGCRVTQRLGTDVFRAIDLATGLPVVLRHLARPRLSNGGAKTVDAERLERACALRHPVLARARCVRIDGGSLLHISEWLGPSLAARGRVRCGGSAVVPAGVEELIQGLDWAHRRGEVHGRVRPGCVFLGPDRRLRLAQLGCAAVVPRVAVDQWSVAAPEALVAPDAPLDPRTDVYGVGLVLFELLSGRSPFERDSSERTLAAVLAGDLPRPDWQRVPRPLREVCRRALAVDPERRWASMAELAEALVLATRPVRDAGSLLKATQLARWFRAAR